MGYKIYDNKSISNLIDKREFDKKIKKLDEMITVGDNGLTRVEESQVTHARAIIDVADKVKKLEDK